MELAHAPEAALSDWFRKHRAEYPDNWDEIAAAVKERAGGRCEACDRPHSSDAILTTHHLDFTPSNCDDGNLIALCARDHLRAHALRPLPATRADAIVRLRRRHEIEIGQLCLPLRILH